MPAPGWVASTEAAVALVAATPKTVLSAISPAAKDMVLVEMSVGFDGVTASATPVLIELTRSSQGAAGTSTAVTARQVRGISQATFAGTAGSNFTVAPTTQL